MACKFCNNFDPRGLEASLSIALSDLQESCRYCSLLRSLVRHFAPRVEDTLLKPFLFIDLQEGNAANVEVAGNYPHNGAGSFGTSAVFHVYNPSRMQIASD